MFKKKSKKGSNASLPAPVAPMDPNNVSLEDDLFAQLDAKEQLSVTPSQNTSQSGQSATTLTSNTSLESSQSSKLQKPKKDSKLRFKAREVS